MTEEAGGAEDLDRLAQTFIEQARRGETPSIEAVASAHPALADEIRELFPVLALVEGLKTEDATGPRRAHALPGRVGDYAIGPELGRGGMGTVYEGRRVAGDGPDRVAVKVIHAHLLERSEFVARFLQEAEAGCRVEHENVVRTLETGLVDAGDVEVPYILLEHVEGQNLRALLREVEIVPERLCRHVGIRLADALAAIHAAGLVHRDVKPENVVITADETVKLMDLGVAVLQDRLQRLSRTGEFVGSLLYAAPGQVAGEPPRPQWDLHTLGILLYELATGQHPARNAGLRWLRAGESARSALTRHDALGALSPFFASVIECLLAADDDGALDTANALREVLEDGESSAWWLARRDTAAASSTRLPRLSRPTAFYGRRDEWQLLDRALTTANETHGQVVLLEGEAGIGKSRLVYEWAGSHRATQTAPRVILLAHAPGDVGGDEPQLAAALAQILGEGDLEARLAELLASRARLAPGLARRLRGEAGGPEGAVYDTAWLSVLQALAQQRPILLVAEDLHFAPPADVDRFLYLARGISAPGLLVVGTFRPDPLPPAIRELGLLEHVAHLELEGLDTEACHQLLLEASVDTPRLGESVQSIAERSDHNPMLLLELVRRLQERAGAEVSAETTVPDSIRGFLAARIAALEPSDRELLETAACQGYEFDPVVVAEASGAGRVHALKRFARMEHGRHLLRAAGRLYQFQHHLVQEVLYADLHPTLRETYHAAIGEALERRMDQPRGADAVTLCTQFWRGQRPRRARPYLRAALTHLEWDRGDYVAADQLAEMALAVKGLLSPADRAFALHVRGKMYISGARLEEALVALEEALELAGDTGDAALASETLVLLAWLARRRQRPHEALDYLERAVLQARQANDTAREAVALSHLAVELMNQGRYDDADSRSRQAFAVLGDADEPYCLNRLTGHRASLRILQGRLEEAHALLTRTASLAHEMGDLPTEALIATELGRLTHRRGQFDESRRHLHAALELGRHMGMPHRDAYLLLNMGQCFLRVGRFEEAARRLLESREIARGRRAPLEEAAASAKLGAVRAAHGELAAAQEDLLSAQAQLKEQGPPDAVVEATVNTADVLSLLGRFEEADRELGQARTALAEQVHPVLDVALISSLGRVREREGRFAEAVALYAQAEELARSGSLLVVPHAFLRARALIGAGRREDAEAVLQETLAWSRENSLPPLTVLAQVHLAGGPHGDPLSARLALEQHAERLTSEERIGAHLALWEADPEPASLESAWRELRRLVLGSPTEDRESMETRVDLFRRVARAWRTEAGEHV